MSNYIGVRCPVCNKKFTEADDIVVCPVCGAPHHRECYMQANQCAFVEEHMDGKEWSDPAGQTAGGAGETRTRSCTRCGAANPDDQIFCQVCGNPLSLYQAPPGADASREQWGPYGAGGPGRPYPNVDAISMAYGGLAPDEEVEGESVRDLARYIGSGSAYYLPRFQLFSAEKRTMSFNFSAFLFSYLYYFYRKMYGVGFVLLALSVASSVPALIRTFEMIPLLPAILGFGSAGAVNQVLIDSMARLGNITNTAYIVIKLVVAFFANHMYFNRVIHSVHEIRVGVGADKAPQHYAELLARSGGCNRTAVAVVAVLIVAGSFLMSGVMLYLRPY